MAFEKGMVASNGDLFIAGQMWHKSIVERRLGAVPKVRYGCWRKPRTINDNLCYVYTFQCERVHKSDKIT